MSPGRILAGPPRPRRPTQHHPTLGWHIVAHRHRWEGMGSGGCVPAIRAALFKNGAAVLVHPPPLPPSPPHAVGHSLSGGDATRDQLGVPGWARHLSRAPLSRARSLLGRVRRQGGRGSGGGIGEDSATSRAPVESRGGGGCHKVPQTMQCNANGTKEIGMQKKCNFAYPPTGDRAGEDCVRVECG